MCYTIDTNFNSLLLFCLLVVIVVVVVVSFLFFLGFAFCTLSSMVIISLRKRENDVCFAESIFPYK